MEQVKQNKIKINMHVFTPSGDKMALKFQRVYDEDKHREIVKQCGCFDIYEFIQASNSQSDLSMLRQQMIETGQVPNVSDEVIDYSLFPDDIHELNNVVTSAESRFNALPDSIKQVFGNKDVFLASLVKGTYEEDIIKYYKTNPQSISPVTENEVKENE